MNSSAQENSHFNELVEMTKDSDSLTIEAGYSGLFELYQESHKPLEKSLQDPYMEVEDAFQIYKENLDEFEVMIQKTHLSVQDVLNWHERVNSKAAVEESKAHLPGNLVIESDLTIPESHQLVLQALHSCGLKNMPEVTKGKISKSIAPIFKILRIGLDKIGNDRVKEIGSQIADAVEKYLPVATAASFGLVLAGLYLSGCNSAEDYCTDEQKAITGEADVDCVDRYGNTALMQFVQKGHFSEAVDLLDKGADINATNKNGATVQVKAFSALGDKIRSGKINQNDLNSLTDLGVDFKAIFYGDTNAMAIAIRTGRTDVVHLLINNELKLDVNSKSSAKALEVAAEGGSTEMVQLFLDSGFNVNGPSGSQVLKVSIKKKKEDIIQLFFDNRLDMNSAAAGEALVAAVDVRNISLVKQLLKEGISLNSSYGGRALLSASIMFDMIPYRKNLSEEEEVKNFEIFQLLIKNGLDVSIYGDEAFLHCVDKYNKCPERFKILFKNKANVNAKNGLDRSALEIVLLNKDAERFKLLISNGADVNTSDYGGVTILMKALKYKSHEMAKLLIEKGADINAVSRKGETALSMAIEHGGLNDVQMLFDHGLDAAIAGSEEILTLVAQKRSVDFMELFFSKGANINNAKKALAVAARVKNFNTFDLLIKNGVEVNQGDENGVTALMWVLYYGKFKYADLLIEKGANVNAANNNSETPLIWAIRGSKNYKKVLYYYAEKNSTYLTDALTAIDEYCNLKRDRYAYKSLHSCNEEVTYYDNGVALLMGNGADVDAVDKNGETALMKAIANKKIEPLLLLYLIEHADLNAVDKNGETALMKAISSGLSVAHDLIQHGVDINAIDKNGETALMKAISSGRYIAYNLIQHGADVNAVYKNGETALMKAASRNFDYIAPDLIQHGADVNAVDKNGETALMKAAAANSLNCAERFLGYVTEIDATDSNGETALMKAVINTNPDFVKLLLRYNADRSIKNNEGKTVREIAEKTKYNSIIEMLRIERSKFWHDLASPYHRLVDKISGL